MEISQIMIEPQLPPDSGYPARSESRGSVLEISPDNYLFLREGGNDTLSFWVEAETERERVFNFMVFHSEDPLITLAEEEMESIQIFFLNLQK